MVYLGTNLCTHQTCLRRFIYHVQIEYFLTSNQAVRFSKSCLIYALILTCLHHIHQIIFCSTIPDRFFFVFVVVAPSRKYVWNKLFMKSDQSSIWRDPAFPGKEAFGISMVENCLYKAGQRERERGRKTRDREKKGLKNCFKCK